MAAQQNAPQPELYLIKIDKYEDMPALTAGGVSESDWKDSFLLNTKGLQLTVLTPEQAAKDTTDVVNALCSSINEKIAYKVINLAWNLRSATDPEIRLFPEASPSIGMAKESSLSSVMSRPIPQTEPAKMAVPTAKSDILETSRAGSFLAASLLKLFTKDESSWMKAQDHIAAGYKKFHGTPYPFEGMTPWEASVSSLRKMFQTKSVFSNTLAGILYSLSEVPKEVRGMSTVMLFEQHLSYTGMHIVGLFWRACLGLKVQPGSLMSALYTPNIEPILDQLQVVIKDYMSSKDKDRCRETFKYARLFNPNMFSHLQTKNCANVVCILANIGIQCGNTGAGNVLDIASVSAMGDLAKENCLMVATNIYNRHCNWKNCENCLNQHCG